MLKILNDKVLMIENKLKFIQNVASGKIKVAELDVSQLVEVMREEGFRQFSVGESSDSFDYILKMEAHYQRGLDLKRLHIIIVPRVLALRLCVI